MNNIANISQINTQKQKNIIKIEFMCHFKYDFEGYKINCSHLAYTLMKCKNCGKHACNKHMKSDRTLCVNCMIKIPYNRYFIMCSACGNVTYSMLTYFNYFDYDMKYNVYICDKCRTK